MNNLRLYVRQVGLNQVRRILCNHFEEADGKADLFEIEKNNEEIVNKLANDFWDRLVNENRIDIGQPPPKKASRASA